MIDDLSYTYGDENDLTKGNQLLSVKDEAGDSRGFVDGDTSDIEYLYDANGNMTIDKNKGISTITYNQLNLPEHAEKESGEFIQYVYNAAGMKLRQAVYNADSMLQKTTDYGSNVAHEELFSEILIRESGYLYIYLSNENNTPMDVFFDDFTVE